jgi:hypothetical protein
MSTQYYCTSQQRRKTVLETSSPALNGIDYLEVLDNDAPAGTPRQQTLIVTLLRTISGSFGPSNVKIEGGVRVPQINVVWAYKGVDLPSSEMTLPAEYDPAKVLVIRTDSNGDYSTYTLSLITSGVDMTPPAGFDAPLSTVDFSFKVECPSDFDCQPVSTCPPTIDPEPVLDYLTKDYTSFRQLMLDRLSVTLPDWTERNAADLGVAIVETLAYAADYLSYYQDAAATEAYLGTARKRISMRRHSRLLDYPMHEGSSARVWLQVKVTPTGTSTLPKGTPFLTRVNKFSSVSLRYPITSPAHLGIEQIVSSGANAGAQIFETLHDAVLYEAHNEINFYTWSDANCCLPAGATRATLREDNANRLRLRIGDVLIFEETVSPETGQEGGANPAHRHAVRLTKVTPEASYSIVDGVETRTPSASPLVDPLTSTQVVEIEWDREDALPFPLCLSTTINGAAQDDLAVALGNIVLADQGMTITDEPLYPDTVPSEGRFRPRLRQGRVTQSAPYDFNLAVSEPASVSMSFDPSQALPAVTLLSAGETWVAKRDLLNSDKLASDFVVEVDEEGTAFLRFGNDVLGKRPAVGDTFTATYRIGMGVEGNVGAGAIAHVITNLNGISAVTNPMPAVGGSDPESIERVRLYAPQAFRVNNRAVTVQDYTEMAERHPEVQSARATIRWTGSWQTAFITVDRKGGAVVDDAFRAELLAFMERFRLMGRDIEINAPKFVSLDIALKVCVAPGYFRTQVKAALLALFSSGYRADGQLGFFHPDNFTFNQKVYLSQIISAATQVQGVSYVTPVRFQRWGKPETLSQTLGYIDIGRLEVARLDNNPNAPENGKIEFIMEGGL